MDLLIRVNVVIKKGVIMELNQEEMRNIIGGSITSSMLNAISKAVNTLYELGKATGSAIRRIISNAYCPLG